MGTKRFVATGRVLCGSGWVPEGVPGDWSTWPRERLTGRRYRPLTRFQNFDPPVLGKTPHPTRPTRIDPNRIRLSLRQRPATASELKTSRDLRPCSRIELGASYAE